MSYEGYTQFLCSNGHEFFLDAYEEDIEECPVCKAPPVWAYGVDQTNGCFHDISLMNTDGSLYCCPVVLEVKEEAVYSTCQHCKHVHLERERTYKLPKEGIGKKL